MKKYFIDADKKGYFFFSKPKKYIFKTGNVLYIFPEKGSKKFIKKYNCESIFETVDSDFREKIYYKTVINVIKEENSNDITIDLKNPLNNLDFLSNLYKREIVFSLTESSYAHQTADYFLEKFGIPIPVVSKINSRLYFCEEDKNISLPANTIKVCLSKSSYYLKDINFPIRIASLPILTGAVTLTGIDFSDIIIKPCIIQTQQE